jgi:hypothetical protein
VQSEQTILFRWSKRAAVSVLVGASFSLLYFAIRYVHVGLSSKLLGDASHFAYKIVWESRALDGLRLDRKPRLLYSLVLALNTLQFAAVILVVLAWKDLLVITRGKSGDDRVRRLATFCFVQVLGLCFLRLEIDPGTLVGCFLLLPGIVVGAWFFDGAVFGMVTTVFLNAVTWFAFHALRMRIRGSAN